MTQRPGVNPYKFGLIGSTDSHTALRGVVEIPTPRWTCTEAARLGAKMPPEVPMTTQERAYTSPIWYKPAAAR